MGGTGWHRVPSQYPQQSLPPDAHACPSAQQQVAGAPALRTTQAAVLSQQSPADMQKFWFGMQGFAQNPLSHSPWQHALLPWQGAPIPPHPVQVPFTQAAPSPQHWKLSQHPDPAGPQSSMQTPPRHLDDSQQSPSDEHRGAHRLRAP